MFNWGWINADTQFLKRNQKYYSKKNENINFLNVSHFADRDKRRERRAPAFKTHTWDKRLISSKKILFILH